jgi:glycosyltransferase involved in cell wall biosynthesis
MLTEKGLFLRLFFLKKYPILSKVMKQLFSFDLIMPVFNESQIIEKVVKQNWDFVKKYKGSQLIIAEDGSTDGTKEILKKLKKKIPFKLVSSNLRKGYTKAVMDALKLSKKDLILFSDSDGQHIASDFDKLLKFYPKYDLIIGKKSPRRDPLYRNLVSKIYNFLVNILFFSHFEDIDCGFRIIKKDVIKKILPKSGRFKYCYFSEFTIIAKRLGFKIKEVPITHYPREGTQSSIFSPTKLPKIGWGLFIQLVELRGRKL